MAYEKINFQDRIDTKPSSYLVDGEVKTIEKDNSGVKQEGSNLNAENLNHMDEGIFKNDKNIQELKKNIQNINIPVISVNGKIGKVELKAEDIKTADGTNLEEFKKKTNSQYEDLANFKKNIECSRLITHNTEDSNVNKYQKIGYMSLTKPYTNCTLIFDIIGYGNKLQSAIYSKLLFEVVQKEMRTLPIVCVQLLETTKFKTDNFKAIVTRNTDEETIVELWFLDTMQFNKVKFQIDIQNNNNFRFELGNFMEKLPNGTNTNCTLGGNAKRLDSIEQALINKGILEAKKNLSI